MSTFLYDVVGSSTWRRWVEKQGPSAPDFVSADLWSILRPPSSLPVRVVLLYFINIKK